MKCSAMQLNGEWIDVQKDPITDPGKKSKAGRVELWKSGGEWISSVEQPNGWHDKAIGGWYPMLNEVYCDGKLIRDYSFEEVRANAKR